MNKKEFEDKIIKLIEDNIYDAEPSRLVIGGTAVERVWQWIEQQINQASNEGWRKGYLKSSNEEKILRKQATKDARIDELKRMQKGAEQLNTGGVTFLSIANRIKELKK